MDEQSTILINQKYNEIIAEQIIVSVEDAREIVRVALQKVGEWGRTMNISMGAVSPQHFDMLVQQVQAKQLERACNQKLHSLIAAHINENNMTARDAVRGSLDKLADWARAQNFPVAGIGVANDEQFEILVKQVEQMIERFRTEQQRGAVALGQGVYADVIDNEDFNERMKRAGLA